MVCAAAGKSLSVASNAMRMLLSVGPDAIGDAIAGASVGGGATWLVMGAAAGAVSTTFSGGDGGDGGGRAARARAEPLATRLDALVVDALVGLVGLVTFGLHLNAPLRRRGRAVR